MATGNSKITHVTVFIQVKATLRYPVPISPDPGTSLQKIYINPGAVCV